MVQAPPLLHERELGAKAYRPWCKSNANLQRGRISSPWPWFFGEILYTSLLYIVFAWRCKGSEISTLTKYFCYYFCLYLFSSSSYNTLPLPTVFSPSPAQPILRRGASTRHRFLSLTIWPVNTKTTRQNPRETLAAWQQCDKNMVRPQSVGGIIPDTCNHKGRNDSWR